MRSILTAFLMCAFAAAGFLGWQYYRSEQDRTHLLEMNSAVSGFLATLETRDVQQIGAAAAELARKFTADDAARFRDVLENAFASRIRKNPDCKQELASALQTLYPHSALAGYIGIEEDRAVAVYYSKLAGQNGLPVKDVSAPAVKPDAARPATAKSEPVKPAQPALPAVKTAPALPSVKREAAALPKKAPAVQTAKTAAAAKPAKPSPAVQLVQSAWQGDVYALRAAIAAGADPQMRVRDQNGKVTTLLSSLLLKTKLASNPGKMIPVIVELMKAGATPSDNDRELIASIPELAAALE